jgi:hypothetical protein
LHSQVRQDSPEEVHTSDFLYGHACGVKVGEGCDKHKGERLKHTFNELIAKYVKMRDAKIAAQPSNMKPSVSPLRHKPKEWNRKAPRRPQPHVKSCFEGTNRPSFQKKEKVIKQVYRVKRDNRKDKSSDLSSSDTKPNVTITTSANIDKDVKQQVDDTQRAKYEQIESEASKVERKLSIPKSEAQPSHPLGLPNWQIIKLQKLNAEEFKAKNMAWVPKQNVQVHGKKDNVMKGAKVTKRWRATKDHLPSKRFA